MTTEDRASDSDLVVQEHCIDLPGETVQCWIGGGTDKLKVILRKHRDVIFDIHLGNGKTYTLESTDSDFYNPRDKKLVYASRHGKVTFKDGERFHIWVSRNFHGALVLSLDGRVIHKIEPNAWDSQNYTEDPKDKPAPIIIAIGGDTTAPATPRKTTRQSLHNDLHGSTVSNPVIVATKTTPVHVSDLSCPVVCVIDGRVEGMPAHIAEYFKKGGDHSGLSDIDPNHVATINWIWGQITGTGAYIKDNWEWLRASLDGKTSQGFKLVKAQVHYVKGKVRFYFSGYSNSNLIFGRGGFGPAHDRIMTIFAGAGKTSSTFAATVKGIAGTFKEYALVSFIFGTATSIAEWQEDANKDGYDLTASLITTTIKTILAAAATTIAVAAIACFLMMISGAAVPVILIGTMTVVAGFLANYFVEAADKLAGRAITHDQSSTDGTSAVIALWMRDVGASTLQRIHENWNYLMHKMTSDYQEIIF
jgi:hypothetical protein